jgi:hypothetical protein
MDRIIACFDWAYDHDLRLCLPQGVAYQADMTSGRVEYGAEYLAKVQAYEGSRIAARVNAGRVAMLSRHLSPGASVLDWGAGSGEFLREARAAGFRVAGFDVIPETRTALESAGAYSDDPGAFDALTLWDTLEHLAEPLQLLERVGPRAMVFVSVPIFTDLREIRQSRHYRPGEHLYYFTEFGLSYWMAMAGFDLVETSAHEVQAGRDSIGAYAFRRP